MQPSWRTVRFAAHCSTGPRPVGAVASNLRPHRPWSGKRSNSREPPCTLCSWVIEPGPLGCCAAPTSSMRRSRCKFSRQYLTSQRAVMIGTLTHPRSQYPAREQGVKWTSPVRKRSLAIVAEWDACAPTNVPAENAATGRSCRAWGVALFSSWQCSRFRKGYGCHLRIFSERYPESRPLSRVPSEAATLLQERSGRRRLGTAAHLYWTHFWTPPGMA